MSPMVDYTWVDIKIYDQAPTQYIARYGYTSRPMVQFHLTLTFYLEANGVTFCFSWFCFIRLYIKINNKSTYICTT